MAIKVLRTTEQSRRNEKLAIAFVGYTTKFPFQVKIEKGLMAVNLMIRYLRNQGTIEIVIMN